MFSAKKLKNKRQEAGYSQVEIASILGISKQSYSNWENGKTKPNQKNLTRLSQILAVDESYFLSEYDVVEIFTQLNESNQGKVISYSQKLLNQQKLASLYTYRVYEGLSAGTGYSYFGDGAYDEVYYDQQLDHDFASWVKGHSMEPTFQNGEVVLIKQTGFDYDGAIYAIDWNGQTYIKKVYREPDGLRLVSINSDYSDKFAPYDESPRIIGKIVGNFAPLEV
ncbi:Predicted transcriptional regulator [Streptococcus henryi]|uniref:Predicted transcriptional regulator n=1 Tax=Streptococcus henryi TaxID=439219 RepID=A0A1G6C1J9_9STRE|nr:helix-turn-helix transcriptional regulator [Streptococcus henryi]SDB26753.1 Predicted transcriptional regulator [Streptococcus henryi]